MTDKQVFFSYGHDENVKYVLIVKEYLEKRGFKVYFDQERLEAGDDWDFELEKALKRQKNVVFFITPHSARRPKGFCLNELAMALVLKREIFPVMLEQEVPPLSIVRKQYLDLTSINKSAENEDFFQAQMERLTQILEGKEILDSEGSQQRLLAELDPLDFTQDFQKHQRFIGREWVFDRVDRWINDEPESKVLWITAEAGYGKSALAAQLTAKHKDVVGVHFCSYNYPSKNNPLNVIKTLAYHLQSQIPEYYDEIVHLDTKDKNAFELYELLISNPLYRIGKDGKVFVIVIDALDETLEDGELIELIGSLEFEIGLPSYVKTIITSRPDARLRQTLSRLNPIELDAQSEENILDCRDFICTKFVELGYTNQLKDQNLINVVLERSEANMLYLTVFFQELGKGAINIQEPKKFPTGLYGIYEAFFRRITLDEDKFYEDFSPLLEVMLAYDEPIPKIILQDILGYNKVKFIRIVSKLGAMLKERNGKYELSHSSIGEWLQNECNVKYLVDANRGESWLKIFFKGLNEQVYKETYLNFGTFNRKLVEYIYIEDGKLKRFFSMMEKKDPVKRGRLFNHLGNIYYYNNEIKKAIKIFEYALKIRELLYQDVPSRWTKDYISTLQSLALSYQKVERIQEAIKLEETSLAILEVLYQKTPSIWINEYTSVLNNLAIFYKAVERIEEAIKLEETSLAILEVLYQKTPYIWAKVYATTLNNLGASYYSLEHLEKAIDSREMSFKIAEEYYSTHPENWVNTFTAVLNGLSFSYQRIGRFKEAIELQEKNFEIVESYYNKYPNPWTETYLIALNNLATLYARTNRVDEAVLLFKTNIKIVEDLYNQNPERWANAYLQALGNLGQCYSVLSNVNESINLQEQSYKMVEEFYNQNPERWVEDYIIRLTNLSNLYHRSGDLEKANKLRKKNHNIVEALYNQNPSRWIEQYINALDGLAITYQSISIETAINLREKSYKIVEELYNQNPERWVEVYIGVSNNLGNSYHDAGYFEDAIKLDEINFNIIEKLYNDSPENWKKFYTHILHSLALSYLKAERIDESIKLGETSLEILEVLYLRTPSMWRKKYVSAMRTLASSYQKVERIEEAIKLKNLALKVSTG